MKKICIACGLAASVAVGTAVCVMMSCSTKKEMCMKKEMQKLYKKAKKALSQLVDM